MKRSTYLRTPALALAAGLVLTACGGGGSDTAGAGSTGSEHGGSHTTDGSAAEANATDISFLTGMTPHHEQAVGMSEIILAKNPPAEVATLATAIKDAQAPEIKQMEAMLAELGQQSSSGEHGSEHGSGHGGGHGGMMSEQEMAALEIATGTQAARLYLEGMIEHHRGAIDASEKQIARGRYEPAIELAQQIKQAQAAEIAEMQALLQAL